MTNVSDTIRARHAAATAKAAKLRSQLEAVMQDCRDLETALKVVEELEGVASKVTQPASSSAASEGPSMPELILLALEEGPKPIAEITAIVTDLSDKAVEANNIRSTAWRMWKSDRIARTGDRYHLLSHAPVETDDEDEVIRKLFN